LVYADLNKDGVINPATEIIEENNYYPFGLKHKGYNELSTENPAGHKYKFQEQERNEELGLNWDSFKWRNYDYAIGRFMNIDPLAEQYSYQSPYNFAENKVIDHVELEGLEGLHHTLANKDGTKSHIIQKNVVFLRQKPQVVPESSTQRQQNRIERRNRDIASEEIGRFNQIKNELKNTYGGEHKNTKGETVTFEISFKEVYVDNPKADTKGELVDGLNKYQFSYVEGLTGKDGKVAPAAIFTSNTEYSSHGSTQGNIVNKNNSNAPYGTYSHEFIHTLAVPDNGYNKGGVLNSPPQSLIPIEIDEIINKSVPAN